MEHLTKEDLTDVIRILADFRDRNYEKAARNKADGIRAKNLAWAKRAERLVNLCIKEKEGAL